MYFSNVHTSKGIVSRQCRISPCKAITAMAIATKVTLNRFSYRRRNNLPESASTCSKAANLLRLG